MRVLTVASEENVALARFLRSAQGYSVEVLPSYHGRLHRLRQFAARLRELPEEEPVVCADAYDVVFLAPPTAIDYRGTILFAAQQRLRCRKISLHQMRGLWVRTPRGRKPYRFVDDGLMLGPAGPLAALLESLPGEDNDCSRTALNRLYADGKIAIDHSQRVFASTGGRDGLEETDYRLRDGRLQNRITGSFPVAVHATDANLVGLNRLLRMLGRPDLELPTGFSHREQYAERQRYHRRVDRTVRDNFLYDELVYFSQDAALYGGLAAAGATLYLLWRRWLSLTLDNPDKVPGAGPPAASAPVPGGPALPDHS